MCLKPCKTSNGQLLLSLSIAVAASIIPVRPELRNDDHSVVDSNAIHRENFGMSCFSFGTSSLLTRARHNAPRVCTSVLFIKIINNDDNKGGSPNLERFPLQHD